MSLLKARAMYADYMPRGVYELRDEFLYNIDAMQEAERKPNQKDVIDAVGIYIEMSMTYLLDASNLVKDSGVHDIMQLMNSYIAELMHEAQLHYFHQEGMTIIDFAMQKGLDKAGPLSHDDVEEIIARIEGSYAEEIEEEH